MGGDTTGMQYLGTSINVTREKEKRETAIDVKPCRFSHQAPTKKLQEAIDYVSGILQESGVTAETDFLAYEILMTRLREFYQIQEIIRKKNFKAYKVTKDKNGDTELIRKPIMKDFDRVEKNLMEMLEKFGMTPKSRSKIVKVVDDKKSKKGDKWDLDKI